MVHLSEIAAQDYNLNLPRYIDSGEVEDLQNLAAYLSLWRHTCARYGRIGSLLASFRPYEKRVVCRTRWPLYHYTT